METGKVRACKSFIPILECPGLLWDGFVIRARIKPLITKHTKEQEVKVLSSRLPRVPGGVVSLRGKSFIKFIVKENPKVNLFLRGKSTQNPRKTSEKVVRVPASTFQKCHYFICISIYN
jgi:hypothetical protein